MSVERLRTSLILSTVVLVLMAIASFAGVFFEGLYRDNVWAASQWRGADVVRLFVAVPLFAGAIYFTRQGSIRGLLVWLGFLLLAVYDYAFYLFAAAFNEMFLLYTAIFSLSIAALIWALPQIDVQAIRQEFTGGVPRRLISGYLVFWVLMLGGLWVAMSIAFLFTGNVPQSVIDSGHPTAIIFALDLAILLPSAGLAAVWLWQDRPWGYVLAVMVNVKGALYALALISMGVFMERAGIEAGGLLFLWMFLTVASLLAALGLLWNMRGSRAGQSVETSAPAEKLV
ncbi:MAG: hypothetical protein EA415_03720 [Sphaerobacteraceae bacterium]|nr:MAG: hypothetical protein EA415_03720 [Sphaerobacteraceae bacterium]